MTTTQKSQPSREISISTMSGWPVLFVILLLIPGSIFTLIWNVNSNDPSVALIVLPILGIITCGIGFGGFFTLQPNEARVLILFGHYKGTERSSGFHWTNPFYTKKRISLRARNLDGEKLKVNDKGGNPIEIAAVVVWRVLDA